MIKTLHFTFFFKNQYKKVLKSIVFVVFFLLNRPLSAELNYPDHHWQEYGLSSKDLKNAPAHLKTITTLAEIVAFFSAYPQDVRSVSYQDNDWLFFFRNGEILYWAQGRLLPKNLRKNYKKYRKYISYYYPNFTENPRNFSSKKIRYIKNHYTKDKLIHAPNYEGKLYKILYKAATRSTLEQQLIDLDFLNQKIPVHRKIANNLLTIHKKIRELARYNPQIANFIKSIHAIHSYSWRKIRGTTSLSFHSFAVAIDIIPKNRNKTIYWAWEEVQNKDWFLVPLEKRWGPPKDIINLFEQYGFIWGGRWILYDNMHFEYRPELLLLQNILQTIQNSL